MKYRMWTEIDNVGRFINVDDIKYFKLAKLPRRNDSMYMALKGTSRIESNLGGFMVHKYYTSFCL